MFLIRVACPKFTVIMRFSKAKKHNLPMRIISQLRQGLCPGFSKGYPSEIEQSREAKGLMLGSDKSRAYCLKMICADFLAGVSLEAGKGDALLSCLTRLIIGLPKPERKQLLEDVQATLCLGSEPSGHA